MGHFKYDKKNQRTLPFNVDILPLPETKRIVIGSSSNYSAYGFEILLSRSLGPFLLSVYLPSGMFVVMSWVSFFVPPDVVPARIVLLVTLCLVLINMFNSTTTRIPISNAVTAMEVWLLACMLLVFLSLVEYTIILRRSVNHNRIIEKQKKDSYMKSFNGEHGEVDYLLQVEEGEREMEIETKVSELLSTKRVKKETKRHHLDAQIQAEANLSLFKMNLDRGATYLFPFLFLCFNLCYWTVYLVIIPSYHRDNITDK